MVVALVLTLGAEPSTPVPPEAGRPESARPETPPVEVVQARAPAPAAPPRVLFVGDSLASQTGHHASVALREAGVDSRVAAAWGIGLFTREQYDRGALVPNPPPTSLLGMASSAVAEFDPDVVAVYSNHNYWPPHPRDADGRSILWGSPTFPGMVRTLLTDLVRRLSAGGARVYLIAPIPLFPPDDQPEDNAIWDAYMAVQAELGVEVVTPGAFLAQPSGERFDELPDCAGRPRRVRPADDVHLTYFGAGLMGGHTAQAVADLVHPAPASAASPASPPVAGPAPARSTAPAERPVALVPGQSGYRLVTCDGATFRFGLHTSALGSAALGQGRDPSDPVVAATATGELRSALLLTASGQVLRLDDALSTAEAATDGPPAGDTRATGDALPAGEDAGAADDGAATGGSTTPTPTVTALEAVDLAAGQKPVGIAAAPDGGYWVATSAGRVTAFDGAPRLGDLRGDDEQVVALAGVPGGTGYYLLTTTGRVVGFGEAPTFGDRHEQAAATELVALAVHPQGQGYWVLDRAGNVHGFGDAVAQGSATDLTMWSQTYKGQQAGRPPVELAAAATPHAEAVALLPTHTGRGYWVALADGAVCHFGDAPTLGGIHRSEVDSLMVYVGQEFYAEGPCTSPPTDRMMALTALFSDVRQIITAR